MNVRAVLALMSAIGCGTLAHAQTLDQQEKCAAQARKTFQEDSHKYDVDEKKMDWAWSRFRMTVKATTT
jgi:hypothetical protein